MPVSGGVTIGPILTAANVKKAKQIQAVDYRVKQGRGSARIHSLVRGGERHIGRPGALAVRQPLWSCGKVWGD
jgi:hypothetical protein